MTIKHGVAHAIFHIQQSNAQWGSISVNFARRRSCPLLNLLAIECNKRIGCRGEHALQMPLSAYCQIKLPGSRDGLISTYDHVGQDSVSRSRVPSESLKLSFMTLCFCKLTKYPRYSAKVGLANWMAENSMLVMKRLFKKRLLCSFAPKIILKMLTMTTIPMKPSSNKAAPNPLIIRLDPIISSDFPYPCGTKKELTEWRIEKYIWFTLAWTLRSIE